MGAFNDWVKGTYLEHPGNRRIADVAHHIMSGAAHCYRLGLERLERNLAPEAPEETKYRIARIEAATTGVAQ